MSFDSAQGFPGEGPGQGFTLAAVSANAGSAAIEIIKRETEKFIAMLSLLQSARSEAAGKEPKIVRGV